MRVPAAALAGLLALGIGPAAAAARPGITNPLASGPVPEQVALVNPAAPDLFQGQFCSGTIRDATHVITAAHCVEPPMDVASRFRVVAGVTDLLNPEATIQTRGVAAISSFPDWVPSGAGGGDAALLTLDAPLNASPAIRQLGTLAEAQPGAVGFIAGWGNVDPATPNVFSNTLQFGLVDVLGDTGCSSYGGDYTAPTMVCAQGRTTTGAVIDACQGDSGGPLENVTLRAGGMIATDALIGIVSFGRGCGDPAFPGVYTEVGNPAISSFLTQASPVQRPVGVVGATIARAGSALAAGADVRCQPGTWTGGPTFQYEFFRFPLVNGKPDLDRTALVAGPTTANTYRLTAAEAGGGVFCITRAANAGGSRFSGSDGIGPVAPSAPAPVATAPSAPRDVSAPTARFTRSRCSARRCTIGLLAADDRGLAGVVLDLRITPIGACSKACRRALRPHAFYLRGSNSFRVFTPKLARGRYRMRAIAIDRAGNRAKAAVIRFRVR